jgi:hypothetical protein
MLNQIDLSRIDLNLLVLFDAIFDEGHVGRTAGRLSLSASAVSHGLGRLRRLLNDPLFLRTPNALAHEQTTNTIQFCKPRSRRCINHLLRSLTPSMTHADEFYCDPGALPRSSEYPNAVVFQGATLE